MAGSGERSYARNIRPKSDRLPVVERPPTECPDCGGYGTQDDGDCSSCDGAGCEECDENGYLTVDCATCEGTGLVSDD